MERETPSYNQGTVKQDYCILKMNDDREALENLFTRWHLSDSDRARLMTIANKDKRVKNQLLQMPELLGALLSAENADGWVNRANQAFNGKTATAVMCELGADGVDKIFRYLMANIYSGGYL